MERKDITIYTADIGSSNKILFKFSGGKISKCVFSGVRDSKNYKQILTIKDENFLFKMTTILKIFFNQKSKLSPDKDTLKFDNLIFKKKDGLCEVSLDNIYYWDVIRPETINFEICTGKSYLFELVKDLVTFPAEEREMKSDVQQIRSEDIRQEFKKDEQKNVNSSGESVTKEDFYYDDSFAIKDQNGNMIIFSFSDRRGKIDCIFRGEIESDGSMIVVGEDSTYSIFHKNLKKALSNTMKNSLAFGDIIFSQVTDAGRLLSVIWIDNYKGGFDTVSEKRFSIPFHLKKQLEEVIHPTSHYKFKYYLGGKQFSRSYS